MEKLIADVVSRVEAETGDDVLDDSEAGPSDEGELPEDETSATEHDESVEDDSESDEEGEEEPSEEDDSEPDQDPETGQDSDPKAEATVDPRDKEIADLRTLVLQTQQQSQQLVSFLQFQLGQQQAAQAPPQKKTKYDGLTEDDAYKALFGGDPKALEGMAPATRSQAEKLAQDFTRDTAKYALDPTLYYREKIREHVIADLEALVGPVVQEHRVREAREAVEAQLKGLGPAERKRVGEVFNSLGTVSVEALKLAADYVRLEGKKQQLADRERKVDTSERQRLANKRAAKQGAARRGRGAPEKNKPIRMREGEDILAFYKRVEQAGG